MKSTSKIHNINRQIAGVSVAILTLTLLVLWLVNTCFLGVFYIREKRQAMISNFQLVNQAAEEGKLKDDSFLLQLEKSHANHNISVVVMDSAGQIILSTTQQSDELFSQLLSAILGQQTQDKNNVLDSEDNYVILRQQDHRLNEEYLVLCGTLGNGNLIMMRSAVEGIRESTNLANRFLVCVGIVALFLSIQAVIISTKRITQPIITLTEISKRMANLDFEAKYVSNKRRNEVDVLGEHMNELSEALEKNILELKQANHDLQADIDLREQRQKSQQTFVANVSHELKTPIAVIQGYAEGLAEGISDDPESREYYCNVIIDEAKKMNRMVLSMISLNQIETGSSQVTYHRFDIVSMISNMLSTMQVLLEQQGITVEFGEEGPVYVYADDFLVEQVLNNYLSNALHYAAGEKRISITLEQRDKHLRISVFNTGTPIPQDSIPHIWDKFYKVDKARTREYGGTGIGLSIVKAVMDSFQQQYGVINHENGVEFWFELEV
ncbi:MAG: HAMP domain-containing sensor histidine kinase [Lachnospiraceae bacterium]|nr:HAMP domain-containing sensor histidine kinase [Lachnospiraceae bacterium]